MKNTLLLIILLATIVSGSIRAQITFTSADLQEAGKTYVTKTDTLTTVNLGTASAISQNWDFSSLLTHYISGPSFDLTSSTPYAADYPNSDLYTYGPAVMFGGFFGGAPVSQQGMNNGYMFWRKDATGFWTEGFMADEGPYAGIKVHTVPQEMIIGTPATLGTNYVNNSKWTLTFDLNAADVDTVYEAFVEKSQSCDAWGSLTTPTGNFPDVLRIHEYGVKVDSAKSYLMGNPLVFLELTRDTFNNYIFVTNGNHYPVALVKADKNNLIRSVEYYFSQGFLGNEAKQDDSEFILFPNPANENITIKMSSIIEKGELVLTDSFGRHVGTFALHSNENQIDCSNFKPGIYFYQIVVDSKTEYGKILIQK